MCRLTGASLRRADAQGALESASPSRAKRSAEAEGAIVCWTVERDDDRDQGAGAGRIRHGSDRRPMVQEAGRSRQRGRAAGRAGDRQGHRRGAGTGCGRAGRHQGGAGHDGRRRQRAGLHQGRRRCSCAAGRQGRREARGGCAKAGARGANGSGQRRHAARSRRPQDDGGEGCLRRRRAGLRPSRPGAERGRDGRRSQAGWTGQPMPARPRPSPMRR